MIVTKSQRVKNDRKREKTSQYDKKLTKKYEIYLSFLKQFANDNFVSSYYNECAKKEACR